MGPFVPIPAFFILISLLLHFLPSKVYGTFNRFEPPPPNSLVLVSRGGGSPLLAPLDSVVSDPSHHHHHPTPHPPPRPLIAASPPLQGVEGPLPLLYWSPRLVHESSNLLRLCPLPPPSPPHPCLALSPIPSSRRTQARPTDLQPLPDPGAGEGVPI